MIKTEEGAKAAVLLFVVFLIVAAGYWAGYHNALDDVRSNVEKICSQHHCWTEVHDSRIEK